MPACVVRCTGSDDEMAGHGVVPVMRRVRAGVGDVGGRLHVDCRGSAVRHCHWRWGGVGMGGVP